MAVIFNLGISDGMMSQVTFTIFESSLIEKSGDHIL